MPAASLSARESCGSQAQPYVGQPHARGLWVHDGSKSARQLEAVRTEAPGEPLPNVPSTATATTACNAASFFGAYGFWPIASSSTGRTALASPASCSAPTPSSASTSGTSTLPPSSSSSSCACLSPDGIPSADPAAAAGPSASVAASLTARARSSSLLLPLPPPPPLILTAAARGRTSGARERMQPPPGSAASPRGDVGGGGREGSLTGLKGWVSEPLCGHSARSLLLSAIPESEQSTPRSARAAAAAAAAVGGLRVHPSPANHPPLVATAAEEEEARGAGPDRASDAARRSGPHNTTPECRSAPAPGGGTSRHLSYGRTGSAPTAAATAAAPSTTRNAPAVEHSAERTEGGLESPGMTTAGGQQPLLRSLSSRLRSALVSQLTWLLSGLVSGPLPAGESQVPAGGAPGGQWQRLVCDEPQRQQHQCQAEEDGALDDQRRRRRLISAAGQAPPPLPPGRLTRTSSAPLARRAASGSFSPPPPFVPIPRPAANGLLFAWPELPPEMHRELWTCADFKLGRRLHRGYASEVYKATCLRSGHDVVLKAYALSSLTDFLTHQALREVRVHSGVEHPEVVQLLAVFKEDDFLVLVLEHVSGCSLEAARQQLGYRLSEAQAVGLVLRPLLRALAHLHERRIAHRDIKPDNLLFASDWRLKLCDFGVSVCLADERAVTRTGSQDYMAPEVLACPLKRSPADFKSDESQAYSLAVDVWSVGVLAYELLVGFPPFPGVLLASKPRPADGTGGGVARCPLVFPASVGPGARCFVEACLQLHPDDRPTAQELLQHPWILTALERTWAGTLYKGWLGPGAGLFGAW
ncbi:hypothetical protein GPECTOR_120g428 [Gonium pectorale]|uniref:Protein kinase domain-containing protein n=1 Tax=Gonium pectorale TaxID=33097 RepID=A0A150FYS5_GONPE|nr:hypothetical protein GPECTOR_120g428 [Gonium pectorale]|eukprot:KXZ42761.1 hypothetical protein GPECTOR_120g428 [Gonium pectorale]